MEPGVFLLGDGRQHEPSRNVRELVAILFRRRRIMLITFLAVIVGFGLAKLLHPRVYVAQMTMAVNRARVDPVVTPSGATQTFSPREVTEEEINSEAQLLHSHDLLRDVVSTLHMEPKKGAKGTDDENARIELGVQRMTSVLSVEPVKKTNLILVKYTSSNPDMAAKVLNRLSELYLAKHAEVYRPHGEVAFFQQQVDQSAQALKDAEDKLKAFSEQQGTTAPQLERDQTLENMKALNATLYETNASIQETEKRIRNLAAQARTTPARQVTQVRESDNSLLLQQLRSTLLALELKRTNLLQTYQPDYPPVVEVEKQIAQAKSALEAAQKNPIREETTDRDPVAQWIANERAKAEADLTALKAKAGATSASIRQEQKTAEDLNNKSIVQADLLRNVKTQEENYLLYKRKVEEARISAELDKRGIVNVVVADAPVTPAFPKSSMLLNPLVGLFLAVLGGLGAGLITEYLDDSFRTPDDLQEVLQLPVLAAIPARDALSAGDEIGSSKRLKVLHQ